MTDVRTVRHILRVKNAAQIYMQKEKEKEEEKEKEKEKEKEGERECD